YLARGAALSHRSHGPKSKLPPLQKCTCAPRLGSAFDLSSTPTGELFALGDDCGEDDAIVVELFDKSGASKGVSKLPPGLVIVPAPEGERGIPTMIAAVSASEAYVSGQTSAKKPYFAAFDG